MLDSLAQYVGESTQETMYWEGPIGVERTADRNALLSVVLTHASSRKVTIRKKTMVENFTAASCKPNAANQPRVFFALAELSLLCRVSIQNTMLWKFNCHFSCCK